METKINFRKYIGTKSLLAFPMNKGDYCKLRNWNLPDNEEPEADESPEYEALEWLKEVYYAYQKRC